MAGIYIHIPFCKQRCTYCDFYTQVAPQKIGEIVDAIISEMNIRRNYLRDEIIDTIYFGGGTPSLLSTLQFKLIFNAIHDLFRVNQNAEITFEANPDDLNPEFLKQIRDLPFNRISIGIQSFNDCFLKSLNRRHTAQQAINAVKNCQIYGFSNISVDLIYGLPGQTLIDWQDELNSVFNLNVQHISVYGLTYEKGTRLWMQREKGIVRESDDELMIEMYNVLLRNMKINGFEAYEISNFALPGYQSKHNSAYWKLNSYIGLGPSAHSFDGVSRQWNIASNAKYISAITNNHIFYETEQLSETDRYNDYLMVSLRTSKGIDLTYLERYFGKKYLSFCLENSSKYIEMQKLILTDNHLRLTSAGIHISNLIISDLMIV